MDVERDPPPIELSVPSTMFINIVKSVKIKLDQLEILRIHRGFSRVKTVALTKVEFYLYNNTLIRVSDVHNPFLPAVEHTLSVHTCSNWG